MRLILPLFILATASARIVCAESFTFDAGTQNWNNYSTEPFLVDSASEHPGVLVVAGHFRDSFRLSRPDDPGWPVDGNYTAISFDLKFLTTGVSLSASYTGFQIQDASGNHSPVFMPATVSTLQDGWM